MTNTDPNALENLPDLTRFTPRALVADFAAEIEMGATRGDPEWSPAAHAFADEILRRMTVGGAR